MANRVQTLVDTSVWIEHFRSTDLELVRLLESKEVLIHSAILGEIAAGSIRNRAQVLGDLKLVPKIIEVDPMEILEFVEIRHLYAKGLSWVDLQLLGSCLTEGCNLYTLDKKLRTVFRQLSKI